MTTKKELAATAREHGAKTFQATCKVHGLAAHYSSNAKCVECGKENSALQLVRTNTDAAYRERRNAGRRKVSAKHRESDEFCEARAAYHRKWHADRMAADPIYVADMRATAVNKNTVRRMRELGRFECAMPSAETLRECFEYVRRAPVDAEMDHAIPLKGYHPLSGEWVVSGLHVSWNLEPMEAKSNNRKNRWFDPESPLEFQKPYNSFPGGQFHGDIGEIEFKRYTLPTTLALWTKDEFRAEMIQAGNEAAEALAA